MTEEKKRLVSFDIARDNARLLKIKFCEIGDLVQKLHELTEDVVQCEAQSLGSAKGSNFLIGFVDFLVKREVIPYNLIRFPVLCQLIEDYEKEWIENRDKNCGRVS